VELCRGDVLVADLAAQRLEKGQEILAIVGGDNVVPLAGHAAVLPIDLDAVEAILRGGGDDDVGKGVARVLGGNEGRKVLRAYEPAQAPLTKRLTRSSPVHPPNVKPAVTL
jgi:hypothetical protein